MLLDAVYMGRCARLAPPGGAARRSGPLDYQEPCSGVLAAETINVVPASANLAFRDRKMVSATRRGDAMLLAAFGGSAVADRRAREALSTTVVSLVKNPRENLRAPSRRPVKGLREGEAACIPTPLRVSTRGSTRTRSESLVFKGVRPALRHGVRLHAGPRRRAIARRAGRDEVGPRGGAGVRRAARRVADRGTPGARHRPRAGHGARLLGPRRVAPRRRSPDGRGGGRRRGAAARARVGGDRPPEGVPRAPDGGRLARRGPRVLRVARRAAPHGGGVGAGA